MAHRKLAVTLLTALMLVWATTYIVTKAAILETPPMLLAELRFLLGLAVLIPLAIALGSFKSMPRPLPIGTLLLMSLLGYVVYYATFNVAFLYSAASQAALIHALLPAGVAVAAVVMLKERLSTRRIVGTALSIAGVALVISFSKQQEHASDPLLGALLMLASVVVWGVFTALAKRLSNVDPIALTTITMSVAAVMMIPIVLWELWDTGMPSLSANAWASIAYLGVFASGAAYVIYSFALRQLDASTVGVYLNLIPVLGVVAAVIFLGETLGPWQVVGGVLALIGMWMAS